MSTVRPPLLPGVGSKPSTALLGPTSATSTLVVPVASLVTPSLSLEGSGASSTSTATLGSGSGEVGVPFEGVELVLDDLLVPGERGH